MREAVAEVVEKQVEAGIDLVNDGEMSKPSYATYIKDRLAGFGGTGNTFVYQDLAQFPRLEQRVFGDPGRSRRKTPACNGPISVRDAEAARIDADNLKAAVAGTKAAETFMSAASPGVVSLFFRNDHYKDHETYLHAIAEAMRHEYETVAKAGIVLQIDCPDLGMGRHIQYADLSLAEFRKRAQHARGGAQPRGRATLPRSSCACTCAGATTRARTTATCRSPTSSTSSSWPSRPPSRWKPPTRATPTNGRVFERVKLPDGKVLIPGVIESKSNFIEHPELIAQRIARYANLVGRENVIAGSDCGYGTWVGQAAVDPDVVWAKFAAMAEGARIATQAVLEVGRSPLPVLHGERGHHANAANISSNAFIWLPAAEDGTRMGVRMPAAYQASSSSRTRAGRPEQRAVGEPRVGQVFRHVVHALLGDRLLDRLHLLDVAGFLPVVAVVGQQRVVGERPAVDGLGRLDVVADAGRDHVADEERGIVAPGWRAAPPASLPCASARRWRTPCRRRSRRQGRSSACAVSRG